MAKIISLKIPNQRKKTIEIFLNEYLDSKNSPIRNQQKLKQAVDVPLFRVLRTVLEDPSKPNAVLIKNCPLDDVLPRVSEHITTNNTKISTTFLQSITEFMGKPITFKNMKDGSLFHFIFPKVGKENQSSSESSKKAFGFHTEISLAENNPDYIFLLCLNQDVRKEAETLVVDLNDLKTKLSEQEIKILQKPYFLNHPADIFYSNSKISPKLMPILHYTDGQMSIRFSKDKMRGTNPTSIKVLKKLNKLLEQTSQSVKLQSGDLLIVNNNFAIHSRSSFKSNIDDDKIRILIRTYAAVQNNKHPFSDSVREYL